ncbi:MAG: hypothetical protein HDT43_01870 [Ruminococcaceae bacterium]|nr:hypothetical protein [Oscillospiraceae bacterium]
MYFNGINEAFCVSGRELYYDLRLEIGLLEFYITVDTQTFGKTGTTVDDLEFYMDPLDALEICEHYLPTDEAYRVLLKLKYYRKQQVAKKDKAYYKLRKRIKELESELEEQKSLVEVVQIDKDKAALIDLYFNGDHCVAANEFAVLLRQNGIKPNLSLVYNTMKKIGVDNE